MLGSARSTLSKSNPGNPVPGLLAAYSFKEGSGTTTADITGNGNTGTLDATASWSTGKWGTGGVKITSGTSTAISFPFGASTSPPYNGISWCVWAKMPSTGNPDYSGIFGRVLSTGSSTRSGLAVMANGSVFYVARWRDDLHFGTAGSASNDGSWHHYAMVDGDTAWAFYKDGTSLASGTRSDSPYTPNSAWQAFPWSLGYIVNDFSSLPGAEYSDLRIFQGQLSANQVNLYMNTPV